MKLIYFYFFFNFNISSVVGSSIFEDEPAIIKQYRRKALELFGVFPKQEDPSNIYPNSLKFYLYTK